MNRKELRNRHEWRKFSYYLFMCHILIMNLFFNIFVWMDSDLSPNIALFFISSLIIWLIIYNWKKDNALLKEVGSW